MHWSSKLTHLKPNKQKFHVYSRIFVMYLYLFKKYKKPDFANAPLASYHICTDVL